MKGSVDKNELVRKIIEHLQAEFEERLRISKSTRAEGNDAECQAEGKYDTLAIEENYLADGLARQARVAADGMAELQKLRLRSFGAGEEIDLSALVEVGFDGAREWFFLAPAAGGTEIELHARTITVITPESPLGLKLMGCHAGSDVPSLKARILSVE